MKRCRGVLFRVGLVHALSPALYFASKAPGSCQRGKRLGGIASEKRKVIRRHSLGSFFYCVSLVSL